jgi:hypothetical protein
METQVEALLAQPKKRKYNWHALFVEADKEITVKIFLKFEFEHCFVIDFIFSGRFNVSFDNRP